MMNRSPELMFRALTLHNNAIRKAKWANSGFTLEQEGDSYALVFYEPRDAVGFCLQARGVLGVFVWGRGALSCRLPLCLNRYCPKPYQPSTS